MLLPILLAQALRIQPPERPMPVSVALVVDADTRASAQAALDAWRAAQAARGVGVVLVVSEGASAEELREELRRLSDSARVEGAILAGDLPVPMLRGAQHLTSAFKMDEDAHPREESSVPSDAYYADFELAWRALPRAEGDGPLAWFELEAASAQRLERDIWVSRVAFEGPRARTLLATWFDGRAKEIEAGPRALLRVASFEGHAYVSESLDAWSARREAWREAMPALFGPGGQGSGSWSAWHHHGGARAFEGFLRDLADPRLDLCIVHAHGEVDSQLLLGEPEARTTEARRAALLRGLRIRLRRAVDGGEAAQAAKARISGEAQVPIEWLDDALDPALEAADRAHAEALALDVAEVRALAPRAKVALLDQCFLGAFQRAGDVATAWLEGGATRVVVANSVNVLQDVAAEQHLGQLAAGEWLGRWHKRSPHLESQCLGDGTFSFAWARGGVPVDPWAEALWSNEALLALLGASDAAPREREVAAWMLARRGALSIEVALRLLRRDPAASVRLQALRALAATRSEEFAGALEFVARDGNELLRRKAVELMAELGETEHIRLLAMAALFDPSPRVAFDAREGLRLLHPDIVRAELDDLAKRLGPRLDAPGVRAELEQLAASPRTAFVDELATLVDASAPERKLVEAARRFRLYRVQRAVPPLLALVEDSSRPVAARVAAAEALGWHGYDRSRSMIGTRLQAVHESKEAPRPVAEAALKSVLRLLAGHNDPLAP